MKWQERRNDVLGSRVEIDVDVFFFRETVGFLESKENGYGDFHDALLDKCLLSLHWFSHSWANYYWAPHGVWWRVLYDRCTAEEEKLLLDLQWLLYYVCASTHSHNSVSVQGSTLQIQGPRGFKGSKGDPVRWGFCCNCHLLEGRCRTSKKKTINK